MPLIFLLPLFCFCDENQFLTINTSEITSDPALVENTSKRIEQLNQSVHYEFLIPDESPKLPINLFLQDHETTFPSNVLSKTTDPILKEQIFASNDPDWLPKFEELFTFPSYEMKLSACKKIYSKNSEYFVQELLKYLANGTADQALILNQLLPDLKQELEEPLIQRLKERQLPPPQHRAIIYTLGRIRSEKSVPLLWNEFQNSSSEEMAYTCVQALANMPHSTPIDQWLQVIQSPFVSVALLSAHAISEYGGTYSEEQIRRILLGEIPVAPKVAEYLLEKVGNYPLEIIVPFFIEVMEKNPNLSLRVATILSQKTGMNLPASPQQWANWWKEQTNPPSPPPSNTDQTSSENMPSSKPDIKVHQPRIRKR
ncbi:MAG TPA: HEAT repeat domain-containing protein [Candidatus Hydrogenedens sp.]|nr:HEAT repeat domain-containing protein [Candidatus Hydrogenedens sp.]